MNQEKPNQRLYNLEEATTTLGGISVWTLRKHIANGTVKVTRLGRRVFLRSEEIERIREQGLPPLHSVQPTDNFVAEAKGNGDTNAQKNV